MKTAISQPQTEHESDDYLIELMGLKADFPTEAMDAYGKVYSRYWQEMFTIAARVTKDQETAQDLLADTFNMVYQRASTFNKGKLKSSGNIRLSILKWMTAIMKNIFFDSYLDEAYKKQEDPIEESYIIEKKLIAQYVEVDCADFTQELEEMEQKFDGQSEPAEEPVDSYNLDKVRDYLATLSERDRDIIVTSYAYHLPGKYTPGTVLDELEKKWDTTRDNIRKILQKFRKSIKADLQTKLVIRK